MRFGPIRPGPSSSLERLRIESAGRDFRIVVPVRREGYRVLLDAIWFSILGGFAVALILILSGRVPREVVPGTLTRAALVGCLILAVLGGAALLWRIAWMIWGREEFAVDRVLAIRRSVGRIGLGTRQFLIERVQNLRAARLRYRVFYPVWGRAFLNHEEHQLLFDVDRWTYHAARGLTRSEAERLADLLRQAIEVRTGMRRAAS